MVQSARFSYVTLERRIDADHAPRALAVLVDEALGRLEPEFRAMDSSMGRPWIAFGKLHQVLPCVASEPKLTERLNFDLLFRWFPLPRRRPVAGGPGFAGLEMGDAVRDKSVFTRKCGGLIAAGISQGRSAAAVVGEAQHYDRLSDGQFTVGGTQIQIREVEACAPARSLQPKDDPRGKGGRLLLRDRRVSTTDLSAARPGLADERGSISQRKLVEHIFGWRKPDRLLGQMKRPGSKKVDWRSRFVVAAYNMIRMRRLIELAKPAV